MELQEIKFNHLLCSLSRTDLHPKDLESQVKSEAQLQTVYLRKDLPTGARSNLSVVQ